MKTNLIIIKLLKQNVLDNNYDGDNDNKNLNKINLRKICGDTENRFKKDRQIFRIFLK